MLVGYSWGAPRGVLKGRLDGFGLRRSAHDDWTKVTLAKGPLANLVTRTSSEQPTFCGRARPNRYAQHTAALDKTSTRAGAHARRKIRARRATEAANQQDQCKEALRAH